MHYLRAHWRGQLSLALSFWGNLAFINFVKALLSPVFQNLNAKFPSPTLAVVTLTYQFLMIVVIFPWQVVGVWRSASLHATRTGKAKWSISAKVVVVLGIIGTVVMLTTSFDVYKQSFLYAFQIETQFPYKVTRDTKMPSLRIAGGIGYGLPNAVRQELEKDSSIRMVILDSSGGRILEARELGAIIRQHKLNTSSIRGCYSACTVAFISGQRRYLAVGASLAFHSYAPVDPSSDSISTLGREQEIDRRLFAQQGVTSTFRGLLYQTKSSDLWYPTVDELLQGNVVHQIVKSSDLDREDSDLMGHGNELADIIKTQPLFVAIKKYDPKLYSRLIAEIAAAIDRGANQAEINSVASGQMWSIFQDAIPKMSDRALTEFGLMMIEQLRSAMNYDPIACLRYLFPKQYGGTGKQEFMSKDQKARFQEFMSRAILDAYSKQSPPVDQEQATESLSLVRERLGGELEFATNGKFANSSDYRRACNAYISFYDAILTKAPHPANTLRYVFSQ